MPAFVPIVICGGSGSRLWPLSRAALPKPFVLLPGREQPLIDDTYARLAGAPLPAPAAVVSITAEAHAFLCKERYRAVGLPAPHLVIAEPSAKNTAPAIAVAVELVRRRFGDDAIVAVLPADHAVDGTEAYCETLFNALQTASREYMTLIGIPPTYPATGFGYIECDSSDAGIVPGGARSMAVKRFVEKPDLAKAQDFLKSGNFLWNGGTFCFRVSTGLAQINAHAPEVAAALPAVFADDSGEGGIAPSAEAYEKFPSISFDYAVMEKTDRAAVIRAAGYTWGDIGSWRAVADSLPADADGNRQVGNVLLESSRKSFAVAGGGRLVAGLGLSNIFIMDTPDALLVAEATHAEKVRGIFDTLQERGMEEAMLPASVRRPWGSYTVLSEGNGYKVKRIDVLPHQRLSLQTHKHRSEHWTCIQGSMGIVIEERDFTMEVDESCYIPLGAKHRMYNSTDAPAAVIEVQIGDYLGEDDIVRYDDEYGRV